MKKTLAGFGLAAVALFCIAAQSLEISFFRSTSVSRTNYVNEIQITNGATLGLVRRTTWPSESLWANTAGLIEPIGGQLTNVLRFTSGLADNATNIAMVIDTAQSWSGDDQQKFMQFRHQGTNVAYITQWGALEIGRSLPGFWFPDKSDAVVAVHDISMGESDTLYFAGSVIDSIADNYDASFSIKVRASSTNPQSQFVMNAYDGTTSRGFGLIPTQSGFGVPYNFDTFFPRFSSDFVPDLAYFKNAGTNKFSIAYDGAITLAGTTNQVTFGATNTAPVSAVAPTKWISVKVAGESAVYRLPLYE